MAGAQMLMLPYAHHSPRANAAVTEGKRVFTLALPRSENRPWITEKSEREARQAAAKLCQRRGLRVLEVWKEPGMHDDLGMYFMYYVVLGKAN